MCGSVKVLSQSPWSKIGRSLLVTLVLIAILQFTFFLAIDKQISESEGKRHANMARKARKRIA